MNLPSKDAGSDPEAFGYGQLWPLQPECSQTRAGLYIYNISPT